MKLVLDNAPRYPIGAPQCVTCCRFTSERKGARRIEEWGDYGVVLSVEYECPRCADQSHQQEGGP